MRMVVGVLLAVFLASASNAVLAEEGRGPAHCVRTSKPVQGGGVSRRVQSGSVTIRGARADACVPSPAPPGAFLDVALAGSAEIEQRLSAIRAADGTTDVKAVLAALGDIFHRTDDPARWARDHEPMPCYAEPYETWRTVLQDLETEAVRDYEKLTRGGDRSWDEVTSSMALRGDAYVASMAALVEAAPAVLATCYALASGGAAATG